MSPSKKQQKQSEMPFIATEQIMEDYLVEKMAIYLAKMSMHDLDLSSRRPSLLAVGSIYVALKICE
jgi:hypothetical protein